MRLKRHVFVLLQAEHVLGELKDMIKCPQGMLVSSLLSSFFVSILSLSLSLSPLSLEICVLC